MSTILLTNDDGVHAEGIEVARRILSPLGRVVTVAPDRERSGAAHALTLTSPLRIRQVETEVWSVDGTPTDCVNVALNRLLDQPPELVFSGINHGANVGDDVTYSGTVCAAMEGALQGVPALAVSIETGGDFHAEGLRRLTASVISRLLERRLPGRTLLNLNFPASTPLGIELTSQANGGFRSAILEKEDPRGGKYYWIGAADEPMDAPSAGTDRDALLRGYASLTPLKLDLTCRDTLGELIRWDLEP